MMIVTGWHDPMACCLPGHLPALEASGFQCSLPRLILEAPRNIFDALSSLGHVLLALCLDSDAVIYLVCRQARPSSQ
jgi:hypothetical protein